MSAFFTAVVPPVTAMTLSVELTGNITPRLPILGENFAAMAMATLLRVPPIYDSLRDHAVSGHGNSSAPAAEARE